ncbi:cytochrome c1 [Sphingomonas astaxanthinifaciens]|uniref:Cytochrome c1 n=1 Tax=Sphingomonas astaxanthinifaciens DSM 22298 TaxID=1123267 RepID=A0ABQ5Z9U2_9SPHN|nr:cytochrome c1 [Sphingomonas astaxanthinifaciens]GLR47362.1 ribosomal protein P2 [Sphingomonas astaxanthinifaciens DSM 22298]
MARIIGFFVGLGFVGVLLFSLVVNGLDYFRNPPEPTAAHEFHKHPRDAELPSAGMMGKFDRAQLQRGFQVYKEVCSACHSLKYVSFYQLHDLGYSEAEVKAIANQWATEVPSINPDTGEAATRKALVSDRFPSPYANETAARAANNNALPPDLSLITEAREDGPNYVYSLITGYADQAGYKNDKGEELLKKFPDAATPQGLYFNPYFANLNIAMPPPLAADGQVTYADGTVATKDQMAKDIAAFLTWTAEPTLERRHSAGWAVLLFLAIATGLAYLSYRNIWAEAKRKVAPRGPLDPENKARMDAAKAESGIAG